MSNAEFEPLQEPNEEARAELRIYQQACGLRVRAALASQGMDVQLLALFCGYSLEFLERLCDGVPGYVHGKSMRDVATALGVPFKELYPDIDAT